MDTLVYFGWNRFSPGVHYIGGLQDGGSLRQIYEGLGVSQDLAFCDLNPEGYDHIVVGDSQFDIPKGKDVFAARLKEHFPQETEGIDGYLNAITDMMEMLKNLGKVKGPSDAIKAYGNLPAVLKWALRSAKKPDRAFYL